MVHRTVKRGELFATFMFDGKDCADMGVYNVTSGAVYTMNLEPMFKDDTLEVPAYDGKYYYGTQITGQQFKFHCFCHDLLTQEYDRLRAWLHPRKIGRLILSDQPYKYYLVKVVSITDLGAYPLTTIQTPQYTLLGDYAKGDVVYTGNFDVTFETVGSAYGYGLAYYRDDLIYDAKAIYGVDYYYNSGLLYKDMSPKLEYSVPANVKNYPIPMYNPGSAASAPVYCIFQDPIDHSHLHFKPNSYIQIDNHTTGTSTVIDLSQISMIDETPEGAQTPTTTWGLSIDMVAQTITVRDEVYYGRFKGSAMSIAPYRDVIELPETFVENIENTNLIEYNSFYINEGIDEDDEPIYVVRVNPKVLEVSKDLIGYYFCCNDNGGAKIKGVNDDPEVNEIYLYADTPTELIPETGVEFNYKEINNTASEMAQYEQNNNVVYLNGKWYIYKDNRGWVETNYFGSKDEFKDIYGNYVPIYKYFGATILDLDDITITTGFNINYMNNGEAVPGSSVPGLKILANMLPRYL